MNSPLELAVEVLDKMMNGDIETSSEINEVFQEEKLSEMLRELIVTLDWNDYFFDEGEFKEEPQQKIQEKIQEVVEIVVNIKERPVIYIFNNTFQINEDFALGQEIPASIISDLQNAQKENILEKAIKATCKIRSRSPQSRNTLQHIGTGWLIAKNIIVTNSHVASYLATGDDKKPAFRSGQEVFVDFIEEYNQTEDEDNPNKARFKVESILYAFNVKTSATQPRYPDIAFLQLSDQSEPSGIVLPDPISFLEQPLEEGSNIAVIGYPGTIQPTDRQEFVNQGSPESLDQSEKFKLGKKVLQPGRLKAASGIEEDDRIAHDCTTFGGNSGSVLVDLKTGTAVGLHFGGTKYDVKNQDLRNYAVPAKTIREIAKREIDLLI
jgi:endonuclease G